MKYSQPNPPQSFRRGLGRSICLLAALALPFVALPAAKAQFVITDQAADPTPLVNDIYSIYPNYQNNDGINYYWDSNPSQTFTTGSNPGGYTLTSLAVRTAGNGGGWGAGSANNWTSNQTFTLTIYSVDGGGVATPVATNTANGALSVQGNWMKWTGLGVALSPNTLYAYGFNNGNTPSGGNWEQMANNNQNLYADGQICRIPLGGGAVTYGGSGASDALFDIGLALGTVSGGTVAIADIGTTAPTPGANDISQLLPAVIPMQNNYGMNYYWDSGPGQVFTTPNSSLPWVMTNLFIKTAGGGGGGWQNSQGFILRIYSVSGATGTLIYSNSYTTALSAQGNWINCSGLSVVLQPNQQYAYSFYRGNGNGSWELMANYDGNPYAGGRMCLINQSSGAINYGSQSATGANSSDAAFMVSLTAPCVWANLPTCVPSASPIYAGTTVALSEAALGSGLSYQWQTDGGSGGALTNISGATSSSLPVNTTGYVAGTYNYAVVVTASGCGSMTSPTLALAVTDASAPVIDTEVTPSPNTTTSFVGLNQSFSVAMHGTLPISYQWYKATDSAGTGATAISGVLNPSATNATLVLANLQLTDAGYYSVQANNSVGSVASTVWAQLDVLPASQMLIHWQTPVSFAGLTAGQILTNSLPGNFFEAAHFGSIGSNITVTIDGRDYTFYGNDSTVSLTGQGGRTQGAWLVGGNTTGNTNMDLALNQFAYDGGSHTITLRNLTPGSNYCVQLFALDNRAPGAGRFTSFQDPANNADISGTIEMTDNKYIIGTFTASGTELAILQNLLPGGSGNINAVIVGTVGWSPAPIFLTQPASVSTYPGRTIQFTSAAEASPVPTYRWKVSTDGGSSFANLSDGALNGATVSGATSNVLTIANVALANNGLVFQNSATNSSGGSLSSSATLSVLTPPSGSGVGSTAVLQLNPVAYWTLNDTVDPSGGGVVAYDAAGTHDGTYGIAAQNGANGVVGPQLADGYPPFASSQGALGLSGSANSWVSTPALNLNTNTATISCWVKPTGIQPGYSALFMNRNSGQAGGLHFRDNNELGYTWVSDNAAQWGHATGLFVPADVWSFCALVITPTNTTWYLYNTNSGLQTHAYTINNPIMPWTGNSAQLRIGGDPNNNARTVNGIIDEVAVFNRSLSQSEIMQLATAAPTLSIQSAGANLQVTWPFGTLLQATSVTGPWTTNVNTSPYTFAPTGTQKFFRVQTQ